MILSEARRIIERRALFWSTVAISTAVIAILIAVALSKDGDGGKPMLDDVVNASTVTTIMVILLGALAGSYDAANGIMRYLVMTGVPRWRLYLNRLAGFTVAALIACLPSLVLGLVAAAAISSKEPANLGDYATAAWGYLLIPIAFGLVSVAVGTLLRSNGGSIGVALTFYLGGTLIAGLVASYLNETLAGYLLPLAVTVLAALEGDEALPLYAAALAVVAWIGAFALAGAWRVHHDEY
jgi:ABC-type transport system involved in multi-copper enzyme maturation permease subunit